MHASSTVIIDYGMGNLRSVEKAIAAVGGLPVIADDPDKIRHAERLILPGVGAFGDAMENLRRGGMDQAIGVAVVMAVEGNSSTMPTPEVGAVLLVQFPDPDQLPLCVQFHV